MRLLYRTRPYEASKGDADALYARWARRCMENMKYGSWKRFKSDIREMARDFAAVSIDPAPRPRVGIVGEILVKYHNMANEHLVEIIESEGGEAVVPDLANFLLYYLYDRVFARKKLLGPLIPGIAGGAAIEILERMRRPMRRALAGTRFGTLHDIRDMARGVDSITSQANQAGEGWLLASEMIRLLDDGVRSVICIQPFACLPNHITGKGVMKELRRRYNGANVLALDYDPSVSSVNQLNRIKLLMASAIC